MTSPKGRILLIDDNLIRLNHAATQLIIAGYSVLPLGTRELSTMLTSRIHSCQMDLVLVRSTLDSKTKELIAEQFDRASVCKLPITGIFDANLLLIVAELLRQDATAA